MDAIETIQTKTKKVYCDGNPKNGDKSMHNKSLGHPRVFLNMGEKDHIDCPYCSRRYQHNETLKECKPL
ncbi:MAG: zinc-finger domain-containing protein [Alphaproteobacteria bacterium]|nr:zinc-finger domain-containing protein [Alphaproteobacteria bacterium]